MNRIFLAVAVVLFLWAAGVALDWIDWGTHRVLLDFGLAAVAAGLLAPFVVVTQRDRV